MVPLRLIGVRCSELADRLVEGVAFSEVARRARKVAHGTPALLWLDVPLDGTGATDFKTLLKAKLSV